MAPADPPAPERDAVQVLRRNNHCSIAQGEAAHEPAAQLLPVLFVRSEAIFRVKVRDSDPKVRDGPFDRAPIGGHEQVRPVLREIFPEPQNILEPRLFWRVDPNEANTGFRRKERGRPEVSVQGYDLMAIASREAVCDLHEADLRATDVESRKDVQQSPHHAIDLRRSAKSGDASKFP